MMVHQNSNKSEQFVNNIEVLNNLKDTIIYRTDIDGSIIFKINISSLKIDTNIT